MGFVRPAGRESVWSRFQGLNTLATIVRPTGRRIGGPSAVQRAFLNVAAPSGTRPRPGTLSHAAVWMIRGGVWWGLRFAKIMERSLGMNIRLPSMNLVRLIVATPAAPPLVAAGQGWAAHHRHEPLPFTGA